MAAKKTSRTVCCICNKEMPKEKTRYIGQDKRACKEHDGVVDQADNIYAVQKQKQEDKKARTERRAAERDRRDQEMSDGLVPKCAVCGTKTVDFPFTLPDHNTCIFYSNQQETPEDWKRILKALPREYSGIVDYVGVVRVCIPCAERLRFPDKFARAAEAVRKMSLGTLFTLGAIVEGCRKEEDGKDTHQE